MELLYQRIVIIFLTRAKKPSLLLVAWFLRCRNSFSFQLPRFCSLKIALPENLSFLFLWFETLPVFLAYVQFFHSLCIDVYQIMLGHLPFCKNYLSICKGNRGIPGYSRLHLMQPLLPEFCGAYRLF